MINLTKFLRIRLKIIKKNILLILRQFFVFLAEPCPMSQRNLPASFWNSHYQYPPMGQYPGGSHVTLGHEALYPDYSSLHLQSDPWAYNLTGQYPRAMTDFTTYMPSTSRYVLIQKPIGSLRV